METNSPVESRMVVVSGIPDVLSISRMIDKLTIHFQSSRSHGGDVEDVRYPTNFNGVAFVTFEKAEDAVRVVQKEHQIMRAKEFPQEYRLTAFPFTPDVFIYVTSAVVDLSAFGDDREPLIQGLRAAHRSVRIQPLHREMRAIAEGPFAAILALREDLISRAGGHRTPASAQTAAVELREAPRNPRALSHKVLDSTSLAKSSHVASSPGISAAAPSHVIPLDRMGPPQSKTRYGAEQAQADVGQASGEAEMKAGIASFFSGLDQLAAEGKQTGVEIFSWKQTRPERSSATQTRLDNVLRADDTNRSNQSSPVGLLTPSESNSGDMEGLSQGSTGDLEDECIWVDSNTFRYIKRFDSMEFSRCLREHDVSAWWDEGADLTRISLTGLQAAETPSEVQRASARLKTLVEHWQSALRVHSVDLERTELPEEQRLLQLCDDANVLFSDVLYMVEGSCVKVVGPSVSSHLFCRRVKEGVAELKEAYM